MERRSFVLMLSLGWTTVSRESDATQLASTLVLERLAVCVQIEGPLNSVYLWQGKLERTEEFRLLIKFLPERAQDLEHRLLRDHPYDIPEWVVISANYVSEKYLSWAQQSSTSDPL